MHRTGFPHLSVHTEKATESANCWIYCSNCLHCYTTKQCVNIYFYGMKCVSPPCVRLIPTPEVQLMLWSRACARLVCGFWHDVNAHYDTLYVVLWRSKTHVMITRKSGVCLIPQHWIFLHLGVFHQARWCPPKICPQSDGWV